MGYAKKPVLELVDLDENISYKFQKNGGLPAFIMRSKDFIDSIKRYRDSYYPFDDYLLDGSHNLHVIGIDLPNINDGAYIGFSNKRSRIPVLGSLLNRKSPMIYALGGEVTYHEGEEEKKIDLVPVPIGNDFQFKIIAKRGRKLTERHFQLKINQESLFNELYSAFLDMTDQLKDYCTNWEPRFRRIYSSFAGYPSSRLERKESLTQQ